MIKFRNELDEISSRLDEMYRTQNTHFKETLDLKQSKLRKQQESYTTTTFNETTRPKSPDNSLSSYNVAAKTIPVQSKSNLSIDDGETDRSLNNKNLRELQSEHYENNQPQKEENKSPKQQTLNDSYEDDFDNNNNTTSNSSN